MTYVIGDIHGMFDPLVELLRRLPLEEGDELVFLGDYIDRGPSSKEVVDFVANLKERGKAVPIKGNHEDMMLRCVEMGDCLTWEFNGAGATLRSFGSMGEIRKRLSFFKSLPIYHEKGKFLMVHGGVKPGVSLDEQEEFDMLWIRDEFIYSVNPIPGRIVVFGHTPLERPLVLEDKIGIDTGCVYGGYLTAIRLEDLKIYQVPCR